MRLTKPTLFTNIPVTCEERDLPGKTFLQTDYYVCFTKFKQCDHLTLRGVMTSHRFWSKTAVYFRFGNSWRKIPRCPLYLLTYIFERLVMILIHMTSKFEQLTYTVRGISMREMCKWRKIGITIFLLLFGGSVLLVRTQTWMFCGKTILQESLVLSCVTLGVPS